MRLSHPVPNLAKIVGESFVMEDKKYFISKKIGSGMSLSMYFFDPKYTEDEVDVK